MDGLDPGILKEFLLLQIQAKLEVLDLGGEKHFLIALVLSCICP